MLTRRNSSAFGRQKRSLPVNLSVAWSLCKLQSCWLRSRCGQPVSNSSQGRKTRSCRQLDLRDLLTTGITEEMLMWEEILGLFCFDSSSVWMWSGVKVIKEKSTQQSLSSFEWIEREISKGSRSRWRKFTGLLKLLIHPVKAYVFSVVSIARAIQAKPLGEGKLQL